MHGYSLVNELSRFGFDLDNLDPSLVYRALRDLESNQLVNSQWVDDSQGPQRRVYRITEQGRLHLAQWVDDLMRARQEINQLLAAYEEVVTIDLEIEQCL